MDGEGSSGIAELRAASRAQIVVFDRREARILEDLIRGEIIQMRQE